jgi:ankyrin repeat protein
LYQTWPGGQTAVIEYLLLHGANINGQDGSSYTPLMWACATGKLEAVKALSRHGANRTIKTDDGGTLLTQAALYGYLDIVKFLVEHGADVNTNCTKHFHSSRVTYAGLANPNPTPSISVGGGGQTSVLKSVSTEIFSGVVSIYNHNPTPLGSAALGGRIAVMEYLLLKGAKINGRDGISYTPLMWACTGNLEVVKLLLRHGADVAIKTDRGQSARSLAAVRKDSAILALLDGASKR